MVEINKPAYDPLQPDQWDAVSDDEQDVPGKWRMMSKHTTMNTRGFCCSAVWQLGVKEYMYCSQLTSMYRCTCIARTRHLYIVHDCALHACVRCIVQHRSCLQQFQTDCWSVETAQLFFFISRPQKNIYNLAGVVEGRRSLKYYTSRFQTYLEEEVWCRSYMWISRKK